MSEPKDGEVMSQWWLKACPNKTIVQDTDGGRYIKKKANWFSHGWDFGTKLEVGECRLARWGKGR